MRPLQCGMITICILEGRISPLPPFPLGIVLFLQIRHAPSSESISRQVESLSAFFAASQVHLLLPVHESREVRQAILHKLDSLIEEDMRARIVAAGVLVGVESIRERPGLVGDAECYEPQHQDYGVHGRHHVQ